MKTGGWVTMKTGGWVTMKNCPVCGPDQARDLNVSQYETVI